MLCYAIYLYISNKAPPSPPPCGVVQEECECDCFFWGGFPSCMEVDGFLIYVRHGDRWFKWGFGGVVAFAFVGLWWVESGFLALSAVDGRWLM